MDSRLRPELHQSRLGPARGWQHRSPEICGRRGNNKWLSQPVCRRDYDDAHLVSFTSLPGRAQGEPARRIDESSLLSRQQRGHGSFYSLLQKNVLDRKRWRTRDDLAYEIIYWIEHTYTRRRRQRGLGKLTRVEFELVFSATLEEAAA